MLIKSIPFVPVSPYKALKIARKMGLIGLGSRLSKLYPKLQLTLLQSESTFEDREYISIALFASIFWLVLISSILIFISIVTSAPTNFLLIIFPASAAISLLAFAYVVNYPKLVISRRVRDIEKNLLFALRHLLIQARSGVSLFDAMVSVSKSNYGIISQELDDAVKKISTGLTDVDVLEEVAIKNPSLYFRRALWQTTNAIRSGADIAKTIESIVTNLANEQRVLIRNYGSQLNPLAFMYMMLGVILPTLGISLMITLSSFSGIQIQQYYFWLILLFLLVFNFNFIGIVKSRRPSVEIYV
jgi:flagellar protein FlaJ